MDIKPIENSSSDTEIYRYRGAILFTIIITFGLMVLSHPILAYAQDASEISLRECIEIALKNNPSLRGTFYNVKGAEFAIKEKRADLLPKINITYTYTRLNEVPKVTLPGGPSRPPIDIYLGSEINYKCDVTVTQPLFTGFAATSAYKLAKVGADISHYIFHQKKDELIMNVCVAYYKTLAARRIKEVAKQAVENLESHERVSSSFV